MARDAETHREAEMRTLFIIAIAATLAGCRQTPVITTPSVVSLPFTGAATKQCVKAQCERKGDDLYVTIQQPAVAGVQTAGVAAVPQAGVQYQTIPGRTYRALAVNWAKLPFPYLKMHSIPTPPTIAAVPQSGVAGIGCSPGIVGGYPGAVGYPVVAAYPAAAGYPGVAAYPGVELNRFAG